MSAIREAQKHKSEMEQQLCTQIQEFTDKTGLRVDRINVSTIEVTACSDEYKQWIYTVEIDVVV
jgi:hypothetical protein